MPTEEYDTIPVTHTSNSRSSVFEALNLYSTLMQRMDEEHWLDSLRDLTAATSPVDWHIRRGSFLFNHYPETVVNGARVIIESVDLDAAQAFVASASNDKVSLATSTQPADAGRTRYVLRPLSRLEQVAWDSYSAGSSIPVSLDPDGITYRVNLRTLKEHMTTYHRYLTSGQRRTFVREAMRTRAMDAAAAPTPHGEWDDNQIRRFTTFLEGVKSKLVPENNPFNKLPLLPHKTLSSRPWGIEIEAPHIGGVNTPEYWDLKRDGSLRSLDVDSQPSRSIDPRYTNPPLISVGDSTNNTGVVPEDPGPEPPMPRDHQTSCAVWTDSYASCDCTYYPTFQAWQTWRRNSDRIRAASSSRTVTGEWNSPVLRSFHSRGLKYLCGELEPRRVNDSAGIHVHVSAADLTAEQAVKLSILYTAFEPLFESEYKRSDNRHYCASVSVPELINRFGQMRIVKNAGLSLREMRFRSRYWTVNLMSLESHGTIEFRAMGPIYNYEHLVKWAYFVRELVNISKRDVPQSEWSKVRTIENLVTLFSKYGKETPTPEWADAEPADDVFSKIIEGLGTENRRLPHSQPLNPNTRGPRLVNDDYSSARTFMQGERPEREVVTAGYSSF